MKRTSRAAPFCMALVEGAAWLTRSPQSEPATVTGNQANSPDPWGSISTVGHKKIMVTGLGHVFDSKQLRG